MRVRKFGVAFAAIVVGIVMSAASCKPDGGVNDGLGGKYEDGVSELQFVSPCGVFAPIQGGFQPNPTTDVRAQVPVPLPFDHRSWRGQSLDAQPETCNTQGTTPTGFCAPYLPASPTQGFNIPAIDLGTGVPAAQPMCARYASTIVHLDPICGNDLGGPEMHALRQQEALLFARDPEELYQSLQDPKYVEGAFCSAWENGTCGRLTDAAWQDDTREQPLTLFGDVTMPRSASIPYPPTPQTPQNQLGSGIPWSTNRLTAFNFYANASNPVGPGMEPNGRSSVKAAQVVQHGFCSHYLDTATDVYAPLGESLWQKYVGGVRSQGTCGCVTIDRDFMHFISFLHQPEPETNNQHGGFLLNFAFRNEFCGVDLGTTDTARFNVSFEWQLSGAGGTVADMIAYPPKRFDGRPLVVPSIVGVQTGGRDGSELDQALSDNLSIKVPQALYESFDRAMVYSGIKSCNINIACPSGDPDNCFPCAPSGQDFGGTAYPRHDPRVPVVPQGQIISPTGPTGTDMCNSADSPFLWKLWNDTQNGRTAANLTNAEVGKLRAVMFASHGGFYDRIRCNSYHDRDKNKDISRCEYVVPAKRVVALPDQLELVFLDTDKEVSNPAYPMFLLVNSFKPRGNGFPFCDRAPLCNDTTPTSCAGLHCTTDADCGGLRCDVNASTCVPIPCTTNGDCPGQQCVANVCAPLPRFLPPHYVTPQQPNFNRSFARLAIAPTSLQGSQCGGIGTAFVCNPISCFLGKLIGDVVDWSATHVHLFDLGR